SACAGMTVTRATLYLQRTEQCAINVVSTSTISTDWEEGSGAGGPPNAKDQASGSTGGATFLAAVHPQKTWAGPGSNFKWAINGEGGSLYSVAGVEDAREKDRVYAGIDIDPAVAQALLIDGDAY